MHLETVPALTRPDLLAPATLAAIRAVAARDPAVADRVRVAEIDPDLADTAALIEAYRLDPRASANCVLVVGRRGGEERFAACVVRPTTRADVNNVVRRVLDTRKATFLAMDRAVEMSGMEYGGITPIGLPDDFRVLVDAGVLDDPTPMIVGSGVRRSKILLPGRDLSAFGAEPVDGLGMAVG